MQPRTTLPEGPSRCPAFANALLVSEPRMLSAFLSNRNKALVIPWYGDVDTEPDSFDPDAGDGHPILVMPTNPDLVRLPHASYGKNVLMGVPTWLLQTPDLDGMMNGRATVLACGMYYPSLSHFRLDVYLHGKHRGRRWFYDHRIDRTEMLSNFRFQEMAKEWNADLGQAPQLTPQFNYLMLH